MQRCSATKLRGSRNSCKRDLSPDYDEVRFSQLIRNSTHSASLRSSGDITIGIPVEGKLPHFEGVDNAKKEVRDYSRLLLRKNQGTCILI